MQYLSLDFLLLNEDELQDAKRQVQEMAYFKWLNDGRPQNRTLEHWKEAELEWIEYFYVPDRSWHDEPSKVH